MPRPSDECRFPKPFATSFADCPAYQPRQFAALDTHNQPIGTYWTCGHLQVHEMPRSGWGHFYGSCALGDAAARLRWTTLLGTDRLRSIESLRLLILPLVEEFSRKLVAVKAKELVTRAEPQRAGLRMEMEVLGERHVEELQALLERQWQLMDRAGMPLTPTIELTRDWIRNFIGGRSLELARRASPEVVDRLPDSVRLFYGYGPKAPDAPRPTWRANS